MVSYDDKRNLCREAYTVARLIEQTIFNQLTPETTPQQFQLAQESLQRLCQRFEANLDLFHYAAISGTHQCIRDVFKDGRARLENLRILQPPPKPAGPQPLPTAADVLEALNATIHMTPDPTAANDTNEFPDETPPR